MHPNEMRQQFSIASVRAVAAEVGLTAIGAARDLLLAAACAAVKPKPACLRRRPAEANAYLRDVRLGQAEVGTFVLALASPVSPRLLVDDVSGVDEPFERTVMRALVSAVGAATQAPAEVAAVHEDLAPFQGWRRAGG